MAWCEEHEAPKTPVLHKRTCRPYALIPRGRRPYHPSLKGTEDPRDVAKQNGSVAGRTRVAKIYKRKRGCGGWVLQEELDYSSSGCRYKL